MRSPRTNAHTLTRPLLLQMSGFVCRQPSVAQPESFGPIGSWKRLLCELRSAFAMLSYPAGIVRCVLFLARVKVALRTRACHGDRDVARASLRAQRDVDDPLRPQTSWPVVRNKSSRTRPPHQREGGRNKRGSNARNSRFRWERQSVLWVASAQRMPRMGAAIVG